MSSEDPVEGEMLFAFLEPRNQDKVLMLMKKSSHTIVLQLINVQHKYVIGLVPIYKRNLHGQIKFM